MFSVSMLCQRRKFNLLSFPLRAFQTKIVYVYIKLKITSNLDLVQLHDHLPLFCNSVFFLGGGGGGGGGVLVVEYNNSFTSTVLTNHLTTWYRSVVIKYDQTKYESRGGGGGGGEEKKTRVPMCISFSSLRAVVN